MPSKHEPFGAVVNEALLAGIYTLCSKHAGSSCLINEGENGMLINPSDNDHIRNSLIKCIDETELFIDSKLSVRKSLLKENFSKKMIRFYNFLNI